MLVYTNFIDRALKSKSNMLQDGNYKHHFNIFYMDFSRTVICCCSNLVAEWTLQNENKYVLNVSNIMIKIRTAKTFIYVLDKSCQAHP